MANSLCENPNVRVIFIVKSLRNFSYGALSVPIILFLELIGLTHEEIGVLMTISLIGNLIICFSLSSHADTIGRKKVMILCSIMKFIAGVIFAFSSNLYYLIFAGIIGTISLSGCELGPFLSIEQAILSDFVDLDYKEPSQKEAKITNVLGWYNLAGFVSNALGAGFASVLIQILKNSGWSDVSSYRMIVLVYSFVGLLTFILYLFINSLAELQVEPQQQLNYLEQPNSMTLKKFFMMGFSDQQTLKIMTIIGILLAIDSFAGQLLPTSFLSYWYHLNWQLSIESMGIIIMITNIISGIGALLASNLVSRFGIINVMVFTHLPSHLFCILVPLAPNKFLSVAMLFLKGFTSNMNISTKQAYLLSLVRSSQKSAAGSVLVNSKALGGIFSPLPLSYMMGNRSPMMRALPFLINAVIKLGFDFGIWVFNAQMKMREKPMMNDKQVCKILEQPRLDLNSKNDEMKQQFIGKQVIKEQII